MRAAQLKIELGLRCHQRGELDEAERFYGEVLAQEPNNAQAAHLQGVVLLQRGRPGEAVAYLSRALDADDAVPDYHNRLAVALAAIGRADAAETHYLRALELAPDHGESHNNYGVLLAGQNRADAAIDHYRRAVAARPDFAEAHNNLGAVLAARGDVDAAIDHYRQALAAVEDYAEAHNNLGAALVMKGELGNAVPAFRRALAINPDLVDAHVNLSEALVRVASFRKAAAHAVQAMTLAPKSAPAHNAYGAAARHLGRVDDAVSHLKSAITLKPDLARAHGNLAIALAEQGRLDEALTRGQVAADLAPDSPDLQLNLAMLMLLAGRFGDGFDRYAWRWRTGEGRYQARDFPAPAWSGEPLAGRTILIWGEQGVGEEVMFASLIPEVAGAAERCLVQCDPRLVPLLERAHPGIEALARTAAPEIDFHCAVGDLCRWLRRDSESFAPPRPYLAADPERAAACRERMDRWRDGVKVGIAWRSIGANAPFSASKTSSLETWAEVLRQPGVAFANLQHGDCADEIAAAEQALGFALYRDPKVDQALNLDDFAAQLAGLDLVITTSNTTAHLAGALGRPVWVLLPYVPDWRWQMGRADSLWYPNARLMRQSRPGDWAGLLKRVAEDLGRFVAPSRS